MHVTNHIRCRRQRLRQGVAAAAMLVAMAAAGQGAAQDVAPGREGVTAFSSAALLANAPANAFDMLIQVPGFTAVDADADVRGYAGAQGNVLIDGARPASKRESISDLLKRIPARSVERIELIRGGVGGIDMAGYPVLANIVRRRTSKSSLAVEVGAVAATNGWSAPQGQVEYAKSWGEQSLELALSAAPELDDDAGTGTIRTFGPSGSIDSESLLDNLATKHKAEGSLAWSRPFAGGKLTATSAVRNEQARIAEDIADAAPAGGLERIDSAEDLTEAEVGARYRRAFGERVTLDAVATHRLGWLNALEESRDDQDTEAFRENTDTGESIARLDLNYERSTVLSLSAGLEGAFNVLESTARLEENGSPVALPGSDVRIEERRGEASFGAAWKPASGWLLEAGSRFEVSAISQTGDSALERRFSYLKPSAAVTWDLASNDQLRLSLAREVGQLDFADFVASASLSEGAVSAGNAQLEPDKTWRTSLAWEHRFWDKGAVTLTWTHDRITDVVDRILVVTPDDVFDAPGNIGDGRRDTLAFDISAPLDRLGVKGGRLRSSLLWRSSAVTDPVTGEKRPISEEKPVEGSISFTQDLPHLRLSWGVDIDHIAERKTKYRFDKITRESEAVGWTVFVERRVGEQWRARLEATDLFGRAFTETHEKYDGPRAPGALEEIEHRDRQSPGFISVSIRRSLG